MISMHKNPVLLYGIQRQSPSLDGRDNHAWLLIRFSGFLCSRCRYIASPFSGLRPI